MKDIEQENFLENILYVTVLYYAQTGKDVV